MPPPRPLEYVRAEEHMLPYRVLFEELLQGEHFRQNFGGREFFEVVRTAFEDHPVPGWPQPVIADDDQAARAIFDRIDHVENAYRLLASLKDRRSYDRSQEVGLNRLEAPLLQVLHRVERTALCLSGGGIRSAALAMGAMQALARFRNAEPGAHYDELELTSALEEFDYLSTVSGGGYIGSWLTAWTYRLNAAARKRAGQNQADPPPPQQAFHDAVRSLAGDVRHTSGDPEQRPVRHLREYTSFLAPKLGFTLDSFALAAIVLRNLFVNWVMIVPILFAVASALQFTRLLQMTHMGLVGPSISSYVWWGMAAVLFLFAGITAGTRLPSSLPPMPVGQAVAEGEFRVLMLFVLPLFLASQAMVRIWFDMGAGWTAHRNALLCAISLVSFLGLMAICTVRVSRQLRHPDWVGAGIERRPRTYALSGIAVSALVSVLLALGVYGAGAAATNALSRQAGAQSTARQATEKGSAQPVRTGSSAQSGTASQKSETGSQSESATTSSVQKLWKFALDERLPNLEAVFAFPAVWLLVLLASSLFSALLGAFEEDIDREWWARAGGLMMSVLVVWTLGMVLAMVAHPLWISTSSLLGGLSLFSIVSGLLGAVGGFSTASAAGAKSSSGLSGVVRFLSKYDILLPAVCGVALLSAMTVITAAEWALVEKVLLKLVPQPGFALRVWAHLIAFALFAALSVVVNLIININIFSLHGMYRMRLMRAFLGASNLQRLPNAFTGFDDTDNIEASLLPVGRGVPLHVINTTVNLVGTTNSAWRQRKAEGFTVSALHSGGWRLGYTSTGRYGGPKGLTLATAMAISGAAFNPNMGYHSSPLVTLMMTFFNVRLGWWLPNPKYRASAPPQAQAQLAGQAQRNLPTAEEAEQAPPAVPPDEAGFLQAAQQGVARPPDLSPDFLRTRSPRLALLPLLQEAFGGTNDEGKYIELTDGGHFENLGLYEMVLRRVRWIVVVDGSADPHCELEDLGNAMRKITIDLGIPIVFAGKPVQMKAGMHEGNLYCAVAEIRYPLTDYVKDAPTGHLLYIKAALTGNEPPDVLQYARTHPTFPHESTANQFFTESQFESYRHLGQHEVSTLLREVNSKWIRGHKPLIRALFEAAERYTHTDKPVRRAGPASIRR